jgi:SAM-dependent methyltransferase
MFDHNARVCVVICTPMAKVTGPRGDLIYDPISPLWHRARAGIHMPTNINICEVSADGMEVGEARSLIAAKCLEMQPPPEFLLFIDSDVIVPYDCFTKLLFRARTHPDYDLFAGVYCLKNPSVPDPLIYTDNGVGAFWDWTVGDILTTDQQGIGAVHMGLTLIRVSLFQKMIDAGLVHGNGADMDDEPFFFTGNFRNDEPGKARMQVGTEDIYFCHKVRQLGAKILVDTAVLAGHHDKATGVTYGLPWEDNSPWRRAKWLPGPDGKRQDEAEAEKGYDAPCVPCNGTGSADEGVKCEGCAGKGQIHVPYKLALDIGAGGERRNWPGYITYTTDIRADTKPDYVQDTLKLSLPPDHFDLVASSHHLEHIGRWDQEIVWAEMFKVLKPGGLIEHIVPDVSWAAAKIAEKEEDEHVYNVLYGAQEAHGYARQWNLHYFGYTPGVAKALAENAGFFDVTTENWKDRPELGYNLIIRGRKPLPDEKPKEALPLATEAPEMLTATETPPVESVQPKVKKKPKRKAKP